jgi:hypothetical protein
MGVGVKSIWSPATAERLMGNDYSIQLTSKGPVPERKMLQIFDGSFSKTLHRCAVCKERRPEPTIILPLAVLMQIQVPRAAMSAASDGARRNSSVVKIRQTAPVSRPTDPCFFVKDESLIVPEPVFLGGWFVFRGGVMFP